MRQGTGHRFATEPRENGNYGQCRVRRVDDGPLGPIHPPGGVKPDRRWIEDTTTNNPIGGYHGSPDSAARRRDI